MNLLSFFKSFVSGSVAADEAEVALGTAFELEHVGDEPIARALALANLKENPQYYSKLVGPTVPAVVDAPVVAPPVEKTDAEKPAEDGYDRRTDEDAPDIQPRFHAKPNFPRISKAANHNGAMIAFRLNKQDADRLAVEGGEAPEDLHLTLVFLGEDASQLDKGRLDDLRGRLRAIARHQAPIHGAINGSGRFSNDGEDALWLHFDSPDLPAFRHLVAQACHDSGFASEVGHGFTPHITVDYADSGEKKPVPPAPQNYDLEFDDVYIVVGGDEDRYALEGDPDKAQRGEPEETLGSDSYSELMRPTGETDTIEGLEAWAQNKGDLLISPIVGGLGCVVVKKGKEVHVGIEGWDAPAYLEDFIVAFQRIHHDYVMTGALCGRDLKGRWMEPDELDRMLCIDEVVTPVFMADDLLVMDGDLTQKTARERHELLRALIGPAGGHAMVLLHVNVTPGVTAEALELAVHRAVDWQPSDGEGLLVYGAKCVRADSLYTHGAATDDAIVYTLPRTRKDATAGAGVFGTPGTAGIIAPEQGTFRKPRHSRNWNATEKGGTEISSVPRPTGKDWFGEGGGVPASPPEVRDLKGAETRGKFLRPEKNFSLGDNVAVGVPLTMIPRRRTGGTEKPNVGSNLDASQGSVVGKSGQVTGGGSGEGDSFGLHTMAHTFVVGELKDGEYKPKADRVNPYEALFQAPGVTLTKHNDCHDPQTGEFCDTSGGMWHGSPTGDLGPDKPHAIHVGTHEAATQALQARIGKPAEGVWNGTRTYGETKLAGQRTMRRLGYFPTGHNSTAPEEDYYPRDRAERPTFAGGHAVRDDHRPNIFQVRIKGEMTNTPETPHSDTKANALMSGQLTRGSARRGFYYRNIGEDSGSISAVVPHPSHLERVVGKAEQPEYGEPHGETNPGGRRKPVKFPETGADMGFNDSYDELSKTGWTDEAREAALEARRRGQRLADGSPHPLVAQAKRYRDAGKSFEDFSRDFSAHNMHGRYWHITNDRDFTIDPTRHPNDVAEGGPGSTPGLMVSSNPEAWRTVYTKRPYAAEIDLSRAVPGRDYDYVQRGSEGHELFIHNTSAVSVRNVKPIADALRSYNRYFNSLPKSEEELRSYWDRVDKMWTDAAREAAQEALRARGWHHAERTPGEVETAETRYEHTEHPGHHVSIDVDGKWQHTETVGGYHVEHGSSTGAKEPADSLREHLAEFHGRTGAYKARRIPGGVLHEHHWHFGDHGIEKYSPDQPRDDQGQWTYAGGFAGAKAAASVYARSRGLTYHTPEHIEIDPEKSANVAQAYDEMKHDPNDPEVKASYEALGRETIAQYHALREAYPNLVIEPAPAGGDDPYKRMEDVLADVRDRHHMYYFPTTGGFGSDAHFDASQHPLLAPSGETDSTGRPLLKNDVFRIVHDYYGHIKDANSFRPDGEENAWKSHSQMYSPLAVKAMTTETRGQTSWVYFGPHGETNRAAKNSSDVHFADQKTGLMPDWTAKRRRPEGATAEGTLLTKDGPPDEARDEQGRWTTGSGHAWQHAPVGTLNPPEAKAPKLAAIEHAGHTFEHEPLSGPESKALRAYQNFGFRRINGQLRSAAFDPSVKTVDDSRLGNTSLTVGKAVKDLDAAIAKGVLKEDTVVFHGINVPRAQLVGAKVGDVITCHGYVSASLLKDVGGRFGSDLAEIRLPAGSHAISMDETGLTGGKGMYGPPPWKTSEAEVILPRDARFRILSMSDNVDAGERHDEDLRSGMGKMHFVLHYEGSSPRPRAVKSEGWS